MSRIKKFSTEQGQVYASVCSDPKQSLLMEVWVGHFQNTDEVRSVLNYCFNEMVHDDLKYWLSDITQLGGAANEDFAEIIKEFDHFLTFSQLKKFAVISNNEASIERKIFTQMLEDHSVKVSTFNNYAEAINWLLVPSIKSKRWKSSPVLNF